MRKLICFICLFSIALAATARREERSDSEEALLDAGRNLASDPEDSETGIRARCGGQHPIVIVRPNNETDLDPEENEIEMKARNGGHQRIVGGVPTSIIYHPYQVSLQEYNQHFCGGSIISPQWVLTAAHCRVQSTPPYTVRVGSSLKNKGGSIYPVVEVKRHELFNAFIDYDIAVVRIFGSFIYNINVQPIPLATQEPPPGAWAVVSGWGRTENGYLSHLRNASVPIVKRKLCESLYLKTGRVTPRMICAGHLSGGHNSCTGDSGGPLVHNRVQVGVVSWAVGCALPDYPSVFSNVAVLRSWVRTNTGI